MIFKPLVLLKDNYLQEIQGERLTHGPSKFDPKLKTLGVSGICLRTISWGPQSFAWS